MNYCARKFFRENISNNAGFDPCVSDVGKLLVSLDTGQHNAFEILAVKRNIVSEIIKELLNIFAEFDGSSGIKNNTDRF